MAQRKTERLLDLVALLLAHRYPVTKAVIKEKIADYRQAKGETFDRVFKRDKSELVATGVPVRLYHIESRAEIASPQEAAQYDGDEVGYAIDRDEYFMPQLDLTAEEWLTLRVIGGAQSSESQDPDLATVWQKLNCQLPREARGRRPEVALAREDRADSAAEQRNLRPLLDAVRDRARLELTYHGIGRDQTTTRTVDPYFMIHHDSVWYLLAYCHLRQGIRIFRASRISAIKRARSREPFEIPAGFDPKAYIGGRSWEFPVEREVTAAMAINPAEAWLVRHELGERAAWTGDRAVSLPVRNPAPFVRWAAANRDRVRVTGPQDLARRVAERVRATREAYRHA